MPAGPRSGYAVGDVGVSATARNRRRVYVVAWAELGAFEVDCVRHHTARPYVDLVHDITAARHPHVYVGVH